MNLDTQIAMKDYPPLKVHNMNGDRIAALTERQKAVNSPGLAANPSLVARLGYEVTPPLAGCKASG